MVDKKVCADMELLSDPVKLKILYLLAGKGKCSREEIAEQIEEFEVNTRQGLIMLQQRGFVIEADGKYELAEKVYGVVFEIYRILNDIAKGKTVPVTAAA